MQGWPPEESEGAASLLLLLPPPPPSSSSPSHPLNSEYGPDQTSLSLSLKFVWLHHQICVTSHLQTVPLLTYYSTSSLLQIPTTAPAPYYRPLLQHQLPTTAPAPYYRSLLQHQLPTTDPYYSSSSLLQIPTAAPAPNYSTISLLPRQAPLPWKYLTRQPKSLRGIDCHVDYAVFTL